MHPGRACCSTVISVTTPPTRLRSDLRVFVTHNAEDLDAYYGRALPRLQAIATVILNEHGHDLSTDELIQAARGCDVIVSHRGVRADSKLFGALPNLAAFLRCAYDISDIDMKAADEAGVLVARAPKSFIASTAELALGLLLSLARGISDATVDYRAGRVPAQRMGMQLGGKTAGIIGFGDIASHLAPQLKALGMVVIAYDPALIIESPDVRQVNLEELLAEADVVLPLAAVNDSTIDMIGAAELAAMKAGALLVNVSRGELLDEEAVGAALDSGRLGGLALDVGRAPDQRPSPALTSRPGVVATPHLGGLTPENADAQASSSVEQVEALTRREMPRRAMNPGTATRLSVLWNRDRADGY